MWESVDMDSSGNLFRNFKFPCFKRINFNPHSATNKTCNKYQQK